MSKALPEDVALLLRLKDNDHAAMSLLVGRYARVIYASALQILRNPSDAEDVAQEVLLKFWLNPSKYNPDLGSLGAWFAAVARNRAVAMIRAPRHADQVLPVSLPSHVNVAAEVECRISFDRLYALFAILPFEQRTFICMAFGDELTHSEIARLTGVPLGTVKTRIRNGLTLLKATSLTRVA